MLVCTVCETLNSPERRFCDNCGASLAGAKLTDTEALPLDVAVADLQPPPVASGHPAPLSAALFIPCPECSELNAPDSVYCEGCGYLLCGAPAPLSAEAVAPGPETRLPALLDAPDGIITDRQEDTPSPQAVSSLSTDEPVRPPTTSDGVADPAMGLPAFVPEVEPVAQSIPHGPARPTLPILPPTSISLLAEGDGTYFNLSGKELILVGRTDTENGVYPDVDLTAHGGEFLGVSRRHMQIRVRGNCWVVEDLGSMNGTWLNNHRLLPGTVQPLKAGDHLLLGSVALRCISA